MKKRECEQRKQMTSLGLPDFETWKQCAERQVKMAHRLQNAGELPSQDWKWEGCTSFCCASSRCRDGCWFASRKHRYLLITEAHRLLSAHPGPLAFGSIAHPKWELPVGELEAIKINAAKQWLYRRFKKLATGVIAVGGFEVSLNVELNGTACWAGNVHVVVAGSDSQALKKALQIERHYRTKPYARPVDVRDVDNLGRRLGYALKRISTRRVAYIDGQGRQNRNQANLTSAEQREFDAWLLGLPVAARTILIGCRLHCEHLRVVNRSGV
jgi:hypothetical protein